MYLLYVISFSFSTRYGQGRHVLLVTNIRAFAIVSFFPHLIIIIISP